MLLLIVFLLPNHHLFCGQNANASVELDLYTEYPMNTSNSENNTLTNIGPNTDIFVKIDRFKYIQTVVIIYKGKSLLDKIFIIMDFMNFNSPVKNRVGWACNHMDFMALPQKLFSYIFKINTLTAAIWITPITQ